MDTIKMKKKTIVKKQKDMTQKELKKLLGETAFKFQQERIKEMKIAYDGIKPQINYDKKYDILFIAFGGGHPCYSTIELTDDLRVDINSKGMIIGIEICDFTKYQKANKFK